MLEHRRRQATRQELEQGQKEIQAADARMKREAKKRGELPIEDAKVGRGGKGSSAPEDKGHDVGSTRSPTVTLPSTEESASASKAPAVSTPKPIEDESGLPKPPEEAHARTPQVLGPKGHEKRESHGVEVIDENQGHEMIEAGPHGRTPESHAVTMAPLFTPEQLDSLHQVQAQAPWLYARLETPQAPALQRPSFLPSTDRDWRVRKEEMDSRSSQELIAHVQTAEAAEKEDLLRHLRQLTYENGLLRDEAQRRIREEVVKPPAGLHERHVQTLLEENLRLQQELRRMSSILPPAKEDDPIFATPNGSSGREEGTGGRGRKTQQRVEENDGRRSSEVDDSKGQESTARKETEEEPVKNSGTGKGRGSKKKEVGSEEDSVHHQTLQVILKVVEGMQKMQDRMSKGSSTDLENEPEMVKHNVELPKLPEWNCESAPIDFADWLLLLAPLMADLTSASEEWWNLTLEESRQWYQRHLTKSPLDRLTRQISPSAKLTTRKWARLEKRTTALLLSAIPESLREEVVSSKSLSTFGILVKGMIAYQPGGLSERQAILAALENPMEAASIGQAVMTLRKWLRWRRRAEEVGVSIPDPTILARGLSKLTKKLVVVHPELNFRLQLVRSSLMVDAVPSHDAISKYSEHLLAELEQMGQQSRKKENTVDLPKVKKFEEQGKETKEKKEARDGDDKEKGKCRFFLTDQGCRRGKHCGFSHDQKDDKRRCWVCGSPDHFAPACTRPKDSKESPPKPKIAKAEKEKGGKQKGEEEGSDDVQPAIKELLKEANDMLRGMNTTPSPSSASTSPSAKGGDSPERNEVVEKLQQQLNALRQKAFQLRRLKKGERQGLLDSGATHPLRPSKKGEDKSTYRVVQVSLADGQVVDMPISPGGSMVSDDDDIEPIVPMGLLTEALGCTVSWSKDQLQVHHPRRGKLPVDQKDGCPQLPRGVALGLIEEIEQVKKGIKFKEDDSFHDEVQWMKHFVEAHPVFRRLPEEIKNSLVVKPGEWSSLPANRRRRKAMKRDGFICHLYAGEEEGFTLQRAWKQVGGDEKELLEVDKKRGSGHDMILNTGPYAGLLRAVWEGKLLGLVGGPNCRTRSVLRHRQVEWTDARPLRRWGGEEFGIVDASPEEKEKLKEDDQLLWRMIFLAALDTYLRRARGLDGQLGFALEQPASPKDYEAAVVSFWDTLEWHDLQKEFGWMETTFSQKPLGGAAVKPTTVGGNLELAPEEFSINGQIHHHVRGSWDLARWPPGMMSMIAEALMTQVLRRPVKLRALSWEEHLLLGHTPSRRDCRVCQETRQQCSPHRKVEHKLAGVLSLDTAGPLKPAYDLGGLQSRYFLVGTLTWALPLGFDADVQGEEVQEGEDEELWPLIEANEEEEADQKDDQAPKDDQVPPKDDKVPLGERRGGLSDAEEEAGRGVFDDDESEEDERAIEAEGEGDEGAIEAEGKEGDAGPPKDFKIEIFRLALPMHSKKSKEVTRTTMDMLLRLRMDGYSVAQIHSDQGHEYAGHFQDWTRRRGIILTKTAGDEPQSNGRAEAAVKALKTMVRKALHQAKETSKWWPWALRHCNEVLRAKRLHQSPDFPPFLTAGGEDGSGMTWPQPVNG